jgi:hypothetical protein
MRIDLISPVYYSQPGDSIASVMQKFRSNYPEESQHQLLEDYYALNQDDFMLRTYLGESQIQQILPAHTAIKLPTQMNWEPGISPVMYKVNQALAYLNRQPAFIRKRVSDVVQSGIPLRQVAAAGKILQSVDAMNEKTEALGSFFGSAGIAMLEQSSERFTDELSEFHEALNQAADAVKEYHEMPLDQRSPSLRLKLTEAQKAVNQNFAELVEGYSRTPKSGGKIHLVNDSRELYRAGKTEGPEFTLVSSEELTDLTNVMRFSKYVGRGALAFEVTLSGVEVYAAYKSQRNWQKTLVEDIEALGLGGVMSYTTAAVLGYFSAPVLIVIIGSGIIGSLFGLLGKHAVDKIWSIA